MSEDRKKKRVAHIGNISGLQGTAEGPNNEGLAQADCNIVYDIMQSMDRSQVMSYQQLQEFRLKESGSISRANHSESNIGKPNGKTAAPKQIKKFQERTFPLMAKCQKSMTFLTKNRCIPKPRAHVGFIPRPPQRPISDLKLNDGYSVSANKRSHNESSTVTKQKSKKNRPSLDSVSTNKLSQNESSTKTKHKSKKSRQSLTASEAKKPKISQSEKNSCDKNTFSKGISEEDPKLSNAETDSDNDFEKFLMEHHPANCVTSSDDSSDSSACSRKVRKSKKIKRKGKKQTVYLAKMKKSKMTCKVLTESEESAESEVEQNENNGIGVGNLRNDSCNSQIPSSKFKKIVEYDNSDDSVSDSNLYDTGALNYDSCNSSDGESKYLNILPAKPTPVASLTELNDTSHYNFLKLKCKIPCYVVIKRDPLLEQKVSLLCTDKSSDIKMAPVIDSCDDDDCIIITATNAKGQCSNSELMTEKSVKNRDTHDENMTSNGCRPQTNSVLSNSNLAEIAYCDKQMAMEVQLDKINLKETTNVNVSSKILAEFGNAEVKEELSRVHVNAIEKPEKHILHNERSSTELDTFNVQILSVASLNESEVIVLSDDSCENDMENKPIINKTNITSADDPDVEIICLDLNDINKEKSASENVGDASKSVLNNKANSNLKENLSNSSNQPIALNEEDCVILDNSEILSENNSTAKCVTGAQQSSLLNGKAVNIYNNERNNANTRNAIKNDISDYDKDSILKTLNTIDFNCIKKVLNEATVNDTQTEKKSDSSSARVENPLFENVTLNRTDDSFAVTQNRNDTCITKLTPVNDSIPCDEAFAINKSNSSKILRVDSSQEHIKVLKHVNVLHSKKNVNVSLCNVSSGSNCDKSSKYCNSNSNISTLQSSVKKGVACSPKVEMNTLILPQKNQQLLPRCTKIESSESALDALDFLVAKSIQNLEEKRKKTILPLVELYQAEYKKFMEIRSTEKNVSAGLKLLEENQAKKLMQISSSIKNIAENDACFHKVKNKFVSNKCDLNKVIKSCAVKTDVSLEEIEEPQECVPEPSSSTLSDVKEDDKVKIFNDAVVEGASEILNLKSVGASSSQKVYNHLINSVCAECGKHAMAACLGCAKVFYCSEKCGVSYWKKGHYATCKR